MFQPEKMMQVYSFSISNTCGIAKEINDEIKHDNLNYGDLTWDLLGACAGVSLPNQLDCESFVS